MKLYHYSVNPYTELKTLEAQRPIADEEKVQAKELHDKYKNITPGLYYQHISFLFDPIERDRWKYYPKNHKVWYKGSKLYEYVVEVNDLGKLGWVLVESPEVTRLILDTKISDEEFYKTYPKIMKEKYIGFNKTSLIKTSKPFVGKSKQYLEKASELIKGSDTGMKYAAYIPHIMLYPEKGVVEYETRNFITL